MTSLKLQVCKKNVADGYGIYSDVTCTVKAHLIHVTVLLLQVKVNGIC